MLNLLKNTDDLIVEWQSRILGVLSPKVPQSREVKWLKVEPHLNINYKTRIYSVLIALQTILYTINPHTSWAKRLKNLMDKYPNVSIQNMGMPKDWYKDIFWENALK